MLRGMTARDLLWWEAYYALEPSLDQRIDLLVASVREMIHNVAVPQKHRKSVEHFLLKFESKQASVPVTSWQHQKAMMLLGLNQG